MAKRWYTQFTDRMGRSCEFAIYDSVYTGSATYVDAGPVPVTIQWMAQGDDKYAPIKASELKASLLTTTSLQYLDVFAYANKRFTCALIIDETVMWAGYAAPEFYTEPFIHTPYLTTITFTDGLVELKNKQFTPPGYVSTDWRQSLIWYIKAALNEINLQLPIYTAIDLDYEFDPLTQVTERILENACIDWRPMRNDDGTFWTWYDALNEVLKTLQARIYQNNGSWIVENIDQKSSTYRVEKYAYTGTYDSTVAAQDDRVALTAWSAGNVIRFVNTPAQLEISPGMKKFLIVQDYAKLDNLLPTGNYQGHFWDSEFTVADQLRHWTVSGGLIYEQMDGGGLRVNLLNSGSVNPVPFGGASPLYIRNSFTLNADNTDGMAALMTAWAGGDIALKVKFSAYPQYADWGDDTKVTGYVRLLLEFDGTSYAIDNTVDNAYDGNSNVKQQYVLQPTLPGPDLLTTYHTHTPSKDSITNYELIISRPPDAEVGSTPTEIDIYLDIACPRISDNTATATDGMVYKGVQVYFEKTGENAEWDAEDKRSYSRETEYLIDDDLLTMPETYEVKFGTTPDGFPSDAGFAVINRHVIFDTNDIAINLWSKHGELHRADDLIFGVNREALHNTYRQAMIKLRGTILDETNTLSFRSVLQDYDSRCYIPISLTWDVMGCMWDGEWLNFYPSTMMGDFNEDFGEDFFID